MINDMNTVINKYTVVDSYNSSIIIDAIARALECSISFEPCPEDGMVDVYIECKEVDVPTIENMLESIAQ